MYSFEIIEHLETLDKNDYGESLEVSIVEVNGYKKYDVRKYNNGKGTKRGICLTARQAAALLRCLCQILCGAYSPICDDCIAEGVRDAEQSD